MSVAASYLCDENLFGEATDVFACLSFRRKMCLKSVMMLSNSKCALANTIGPLNTKVIVFQVKVKLSEYFRGHCLKNWEF